MIKIAYVINYIVKNGPSSVVLNLIANLDTTKYDVSLITLFSGNDNEVISYLSKAGVTVYECTTLTRGRCLLGQSEEFFNIMKAGQFDILHTHGLIPDVLSSRVTNIRKKIATIHNNLFEDYFTTYGFIKSRIFIALHLYALRKLDKCVCCSKSVYLVLKQKLNNTTFIRNGIKEATTLSIIKRGELEIPQGATIFLYSGGLNKRKNIVWLIEEFVKYHSEAEYLLVLGNGKDENICRQKSDDHVRILGFQTDPIAYMNLADIYVSASTAEGFSISVLEALSCGLGLFLSAIPSHCEVFEIDTKIYLGERFELSSKSFKSMLEQLRDNLYKLNKEKIKDFQEGYLSGKYMATQYMKLYDTCVRDFRNEK